MPEGVDQHSTRREFFYKATATLEIARGIAESFPVSGVTVNSVLPGPTESEGVSIFVEGLAKQQGKTKEDVGGRANRTENTQLPRLVRCLHQDRSGMDRCQADRRDRGDQAAA